MSTAVMMGHVAGASPRLKARTAGAQWLIIIVLAAFAEFFVRGKVVGDGDAAATAANILEHERLYRLGAAAALVYLACDVAVAVIFYELLEPVSRSLSLLASFFRLAMVAVLGANLLNLFAPLVLLKSAASLTGFEAAQLQALALVSVRLYTQVYFVSLLFFGVHCLLLGYLIYRSTFFPRIVGVLMGLAGACYLINGFANVLAPEQAARVFPYLMLLGLPGELSLTVWLLAVGVNDQRWRDQAGAAEEWRSRHAVNA